MKNIRAINVEIVRHRGKPLFYSINPITIGPERFALLAGMAAGAIRAEEIKERIARGEARQARLAKRN